MIKRINNISLGLGLIVSLLVLIIFRNVEYLIAYIVGFCASNLNFFINHKFIQISKEKRGFLSNISTNLIVRLLIYCVVLAIVIRQMSEYAVLFTFVGCLSIRISIVLSEMRRR